MKRRAFVGAAAAAAAAAAAGSSTRASAQLLPGTQYVQQSNLAVSVPLSGPLQSYGQQVVNGVRGAIDYVNRFAAPIQRAFGIRTFDDRNSPPIAASNVQIAGADPSVIAMIGGLTADTTLNMLTQCSNLGMPLLVPTVTADELTQRAYRCVFRLPTSDASEGALFARGALLGRKDIASLAIALDSGYGGDVAQGFVQQAKAYHRPSDTMLFPAGGFDPAAAARAIVARSPNYIFLAGRVDDLGPLCEALHLVNYVGEFGASDGFYTTETIAKYARFLMGSLVGTSFPPLQRVVSQMQQFGAYARDFGAFTAFSAFSYAAAQIAIAASQRSNATTRIAQLTALHTGTAFDTVVGEFSFNYSGDPQVPNLYLYEVGKDGFTYRKSAIATPYVV